MNLEVVLKPCPWCKKTPDIWMPTGMETWQWIISCRNPQCGVKPSSPHVSIRKTTKKNFPALWLKVANLADSWNRGNPVRAIEKKVIDLEPLRAFGLDLDYVKDRAHMLIIYAE